ncbi:MAG: hypothetical protein JJU28_06910 [Cyclobacteriaceae bacterium]|nr:hypothetical protein [Cyclobacteriaceae bacterium]
MKKALLPLLCIYMFLHSELNAQQLGLSFSYFFPRNGDFSVPVTPLSYRGLGFNINRYIRPETGITLYRMSGLSFTNLPFETKEPFFGPMFTIMIPVDMVIEFPIGNTELRLKGGGFGFHNFGIKVQQGNIDRALREFFDYDILNAETRFENQPGLGYRVGAEWIFHISGKFSFTAEAIYHGGFANIALSGDYAAYGNNTTSQGNFNFPNARLDFTGYEISLGVLFNP